MDKKPKRPRDINQLAKYITDLATAPDVPKDVGNEVVIRGRAGGLVGGKARAESMVSEDRIKSAKQAANVRWGKIK